MKMIEEEGDQVAVALLPAIQYYTGQLLDVAKLTKAAQAKGIIVGVDLAHAIGNVPIHLDDWNVDFAAWCTYKVSLIVRLGNYHLINQIICFGLPLPLVLKFRCRRHGCNLRE